MNNKLKWIALIAIIATLTLAFKDTTETYKVQVINTETSIVEQELDAHSEQGAEVISDTMKMKFSDAKYRVEIVAE